MSKKDTFTYETVCGREGKGHRFGKNRWIWYFCFSELVFIVYSVAITTLTSTLGGRQAACPEEVVTYTCNVTTAIAISWTVAPIFVMESLVRFGPTTPLNQEVTCTTMQCAGFDFLATLTNVGPLDMNGLADMTTTFRFTARAGLNGTVVQCSGATSPSTPSESLNFTVAGKCYHREVPGWYIFSCSLPSLVDSFSDV